MVLFKHLFIDVKLFHCIIVEHILECFVWWHSVSYVSYYFTLGHTPILEFIRSFADFLTARSISWSLQVVILRHTSFSTLLLGHTPLFGFITSHVDFMVVRPIFNPYELSPKASPYLQFIWDIPFPSTCLGHHPTISLFMALPFFFFIFYGASPIVSLFRAPPPPPPFLQFV